MTARPAAGGGRWVDVPPERLSKWISGFRTRHGSVTVERPDATPPGGWITLVGDDGSRATFHTPAGAVVPPPTGEPSLLDLDRLVAAAEEDRTLGLLLARKNAVAIGVIKNGAVATSKVERYYVQARTAAGGWSQQRYARRRGNQATAAVRDAAEIVLRVVEPYRRQLSALVCGGDRTTVDAILEDPRLAELAALRSARLLDVPEPRYAVLEEAAVTARSVTIHVLDPS
ncbi:acVLRF1 family peptidyl-tRNA hydrolase [Hamadaea tsunoensis]|uniref:acVLRF1 family peptidyl-tRNA hydrolase n=1 Tax=Hamadaea tsunoensis TaxID=53368 RepID=UPI0004131CCC|nr:acVLRF1 family peptidyl-tRNA hydrolase [Hamadaea tsunoensis]